MYFSAIEITKRKSESTILKTISIDEITNTEDLQEIFVDDIASSNAVTNISVGTNSAKFDSGKKLSLSPICSISTQEPPLIAKIVTSRAVTCKFYDSHKDLLGLDSASSPSDLSHDNQTSNAVSTSNAISSNAVSTSNALSIEVSRPKLSKRLRFKCRIPPEIRIAEYMQTVEKEILPLKLMLSDIICKCSALGLTLGSKQPSEQSLMNKSVSTYTVPEITTSEEIIKSNRVVYSFVFEG